ncbi:MAG: hypothetical protein K2Y08_00760 [Alphaproteobacteria bacterium]|nr:hypothetical protein [Alphaproteobacteria bacterium]
MPEPGDLPERVISLLRGVRQKSRSTVSGDDKKLSSQPTAGTLWPFIVTFFTFLF